MNEWPNDKANLDHQWWWSMNTIEMGVIFQDFPIILLSSLLLLFFHRPEVLNLFIYLSSWSDSVADLRNYLLIQCWFRLASEWLSLLRSFSVVSSLSRSIDNYVQGLPPPPPQGPPSQAQHHRLFFHKSIVLIGTSIQCNQSHFSCIEYYYCYPAPNLSISTQSRFVITMSDTGGLNDSPPLHSTPVHCECLLNWAFHDE